MTEDGSSTRGVPGPGCFVGLVLLPLVLMRALLAGVDVCRNGHPRDEANLTHTANGLRACRTCLRAKGQRYLERRRQAGNPKKGGGGRRGDSSPQPPYPPNVAPRFWAKVDRRSSAECWEWVGGTRNASGYGVFMIKGWTKQAHRVAYELTVGPIAPGMTVDHRCFNKACVNPSHFEIVTLAENGRRGAVERRTYTRATHCKHGHEMAGDNVGVDGRGERYCRMCGIARNAAARARAQ